MNSIERAIEMALLCSPEPVGVRALTELCAEDGGDEAAVRAALDSLAARWRDSAFEIVESAGGWRLRSRAECADLLRRLSPERPQRLSRPLLETLAVIAYHQPATRGDIERIRGVTVSPNHIGFLEECGWIEEAGRRETPGRPQLFATTTVFLDDLGLTSLDELPPPEEFENIDFTAPTANGDDDAGHRDDDDDDGANKGESKDAQHN